MQPVAISTAVARADKWFS